MWGRHGAVGGHYITHCIVPKELERHLRWMLTTEQYCNNVRRCVLLQDTHSNHVHVVAVKSHKMVTMTPSQCQISTCNSRGKHGTLNLSQFCILG